MALGKLAWPLLGHCLKKTDSNPHRRAGPNVLGMGELAPHTQVRWHHQTPQVWENYPDGMDVGELALTLT